MRPFARRLTVDDFSAGTIAEFWSRVRVSPIGCLIYEGKQVCIGGYSRMRTKTGRCLAHRAAYAMTWGECPAGFDLLHSCDNPRCVNPQHLRPGTPTENVSDRDRRNRTSRRRPS